MDGAVEHFEECARLWAELAILRYRLAMFRVTHG